MPESIASFIIFIACLLPANEVYGQAVIPRFETIGVNDGLSQSSVYCVYQDKAGFIWIGTADGLNRYDGASIKTFRVPSSPSHLRTSYVRGQIFEDANNNLWFANESGIHCYNAIQERVVTAREFPLSSYN